MLGTNPEQLSDVPIANLQVPFMPRKSHDAVFNLVKSMTRSERRYFKVLASRSHSSDELRIVRLFDLMHGQKNYDESVILKAEKLSAARLATYKTRLYDYILNGLQAFHKNNGIERKIIRLLDQIEILYQKGLYDQASALIEKAKKLAKENGKDILLAKAIDWERHLTVYQSSKTGHLQQNLEAVKGNSKNVLSDIEITGYLSDLYASIYKIFCQEGRVARSATAREAIEHLIDSSFNQFQFNTLSEAQQIKYNRALYTAYMLLGRGADSVIKAQMNRRIYEHSHNKEAINKDDYLHANNHLIISFHQEQQPMEALKVIEELRTLSSRHPEFETAHYRSRIFDYTAFHELEAHIAAGNHAQILHILPSLEKQLHDHLHALNPVNVQSKKYRIALGYFAVGNYKDSIKCIHQLLGQDSAAFREDIQNSTDLLLLLNHFALGNWDVIENKVGILIRLLDKTNRLYPPQKHLLLFLREQSLSKTASTRKCIPANFLKDLHLLESESPKGVQVLSYFNVSGWLQQFVREQQEPLVINQYQGQKAKAS